MRASTDNASGTESARRPTVRWGVCLVVLAAMLGGGLLLYFADPVKNSIYPPCMFHELTGLHCPGCGTARALHRLVHLDLMGALRMNPLFVIAMPFVGYLLWRDYAPGRKRVCLHPAWLWGMLAVVILFGILRNLPWAPFSWLAPG